MMKRNKNISIKEGLSIVVLLFLYNKTQYSVLNICIANFETYKGFKLKVLK